jgi:hypothetical protein
MPSRHLRTLAEVFEDPVRANILWSDVESMLRYLGATPKERAGSRVAFTLNGRRSVFHKPHPRKEISPAMVRDLRMFLAESGVEP